MIDPLFNLKDAPKIDIVSDIEPVLSLAMMEANEEIYKSFGANTKFLNIGVVHSWPYESPTPGRPKCERGKEYLKNDCDYDFTGEIFKHFYFNMKKSGITKENL